MPDMHINIMSIFITEALCLVTYMQLFWTIVEVKENNSLYNTSLLLLG